MMARSSWVTYPFLLFAAPSPILAPHKSYTYTVTLHQPTSYAWLGITTTLGARRQNIARECGILQEQAIKVLTCCM